MKKVLVVLLLLGCGLAAQAAPVTWVLKDVRFDDGALNVRERCDRYLLFACFITPSM